MQDISRNLGTIFNNIAREANVLVDDLAREGAFRSSILLMFSLLCFFVISVVFGMPM